MPDSIFSGSVEGMSDAGTLFGIPGDAGDESGFFRFDAENSDLMDTDASLTDGTGFDLDFSAVGDPLPSTVDEQLMPAFEQQLAAAEDGSCKSGHSGFRSGGAQDNAGQPSPSAATERSEVVDGPKLKRVAFEDSGPDMLRERQPKRVAFEQQPTEIPPPPQQRARPKPTPTTTRPEAPAAPQRPAGKRSEYVQSVRAAVERVQALVGSAEVPPVS
eukprot:TRINITY_DN20802_c0_g1_i1.p1 TRINITY_DN20802_c0_g1~~TRINITY_DN20802_c0_g1_i1.p1  ORF type:complete len:216 (+),score=24.85 TRINITY_DN20802_c0_g1_i1:58-705(+)